MARSSPGVGRIVAILNFFAEHPGQAFTLTDLVRALKLSRATCHALLTGLVESGYLFRASDKSYVLGPTLAAIGRIANEHFSPLQVAQPEMRALADEFDSICSAIFLERDEVVVRARASAMSQLGWSIPQGARMKLRPPFGAVYFAWDLPEVAERWVDELSPPPTAQQRAALMEEMGHARTRGYSFGVRNLNVAAERVAPEQLFSGQPSEFPVVPVVKIEPQEVYRLAFIVAPVFDAQRRVAFVLGLMGFTSEVRGEQIERMGKRLREACDRITGFTSGRLPQVSAG
jgi:DNA-binding IclR family transcriptional regulator